MKDGWRHVEKMAHTVPCKVLTDMQTVPSSYLLNDFSYFIHQHSRLAYRNCLIQCFLRYFHYLCLDFMLRFAIEDCKVIIPVISIDIDADIDVDLISEVQGPS